VHVAASPERKALLENMAWAVETVRAEEFATNPGRHCDRCDFVSICPAKGAVAVVRS